MNLMNILKALLLVIFCGAGLLSFLAYFGKLHYWLELISHFRLQYLVLIAISGLSLIFCKGRKWILPTLAFLLVSGVSIVPYYFPPAEPVTTNAAFRLMNVNVLKQNRNYKLLGQAIQKYQPDILALQEPDQAWLDGLQPYLKNYPHRKLIPLNNNFGIALYSKLPVSRFEEKSFGKDYLGMKFPSILAKLQWAGKSLSILTTHPLPPSGGFEVRNSQLADMAKQRASFGKSLIITGDLNAAQWSPYFQELLKKANLRDSQMGFGVQPSWMVNYPLVAIPIDHVLVSPSFKVINRRIGPDIGSDHRPVIVDLAL